MDQAKKNARAFEKWLHDMGYQYIGPTRFYKLTVPEMARLRRAWLDEKRAEREQETQRMPGGSGAKARAQRANPHRNKPRIRESDRQLQRNFAQGRAT